MDDTYVKVLLALLLLGVCVHGFLTYRASQAFERAERGDFWEYKCVETERESAYKEGTKAYLDERFSDLGEDGWEMVGYAMNDGVNARQVCFKRPADFK